MVRCAIEQPKKVNDYSAVAGGLPPPNHDGQQSQARGTPYEAFERLLRVCPIRTSSAGLSGRGIAGRKGQSIAGAPLRRK